MIPDDFFQKFFCSLKQCQWLSPYHHHQHPTSSTLYPSLLIGLGAQHLHLLVLMLPLSQGGVSIWLFHQSHLMLLYIIISTVNKILSIMAFLRFSNSPAFFTIALRHHLHSLAFKVSTFIFFIASLLIMPFFSCYLIALLYQ